MHENEADSNLTPQNIAGFVHGGLMSSIRQILGACQSRKPTSNNGNLLLWEAGVFSIILELCRKSSCIAIIIGVLHLNRMEQEPMQEGAAFKHWHMPPKGSTEHHHQQKTTRPYTCVGFKRMREEM